MTIRRRTLLAAGTAAAVAGTGAVDRAYAAGTDPLWQEYVRTPYTHPQIPNVSFAGYRHGATPPTPPVVANVLDFGARADGSADTIPALTRAIAAAVKAGGGAVLLPAGRYRIDSVLRLGDSNVVLRGAGSGKTTIAPSRSLTDVIGRYRDPWGSTHSAWSWAGGLVWLSPTVRFEQTLKDIRAGTPRASEIWTGNTTLATLTADARRGSFTVTVNSTGKLSAGQRVLLKIDDDRSFGLLRHMAGDVPGAARYDWASKTKLLAHRPFVWPVRIAKVSGTRVTLDQPLPLDARVSWKARFTTVGPVLTESGVEGLTIALPLTTQQSHLEDKGYNGLAFQCAWDCWARDVVVTNSDNGILVVSGKSLTLTGVHVGGRMRHHSYACREQSHDNLFENFSIDQATVPLGKGAIHHGINMEGFSCGNAWSVGRMDNGTFDTHRLMPFGNVRTQITLDNDGRHGGSTDAGPLYGARFTHWGITVTNGRAGCVRLDAVAPFSATVAISAVRDFGQVDHPDFSGALSTRLDSYGTTTVNPPNLYTAQRALRTG